MRNLTYALWAIFCLAIPAGAEPRLGQEAPAASTRHVLENGASVLMHRVPGVEQVAVEAFYAVGLVHEPAGMPQAAHLLEHLVCNAATASYKAGESMVWLNQNGMANAETLPDWTHYDYMGAPDQLERILMIEAERLGSLKIDEAIIAQEGPRAAQEVDFVENNPRAGMGKFAFCALAQGWRHGRDVVHIRTGLDEFSPEALASFHDSTYRPDTLTLVIVGDFDEAEALDMARQHIGALPKSDAPPIEAIDWSKVPKRATVEWDSKVQAVCIAFPPPQDAVERAVLSLLGAMMQQGLAGDAELQKMVDAVYTPNHLWPVGELPFFIYAAAKPGVDLAKLEAALAARVKALVEKGGGIPPATIGLYERQRRITPAALANDARLLAAVDEGLREASLRGSARGFASLSGRDEKQALAMVMAQQAILWAVADRFLGEDPAALVADLQGLTPDRLAEILRENLSEERMIVTHLVAEKGE